jgi:membrane fusion protein, multidrug efflux system
MCLEFCVPELFDDSDGQQMNADGGVSEPRPIYRNPWVIWTLLLVVAVVGLYFILHNRGGGSAKPATSGGGRGQMSGPVTATVTKAYKGNIGVYQDAIGTVTPVYTASITAQASGVIKTVRYSEGQFVKKGEALIEIDPRPYEAQLMQAEGTLERDTNLLAQAQMDLERYRTAWARNGINKQLLDDQEKIVLQDQGTVKNDQGTVYYDKVELDFCHIIAPISGRVGLRLVDPGNVVQAGGSTVLVVITQVQPITVIFTIAEDSLGQVQTRLKKMHTLPVEAWDRAQTKQVAAGKLITVDNQIDTTTGTVKLRAQFDNKDGALFPNQFVNTRLLVNTLNDVTLIPSAAIQHNGPVSFVYVVAGSGKTKDLVANIRNVTTGVTDGGMTAVEGINPGEAVATSSFEKLQNGSKVVVAKQAPAANAPAGNNP